MLIYLQEIRRAIIKSALLLLSIFIILFFFSDHLYDIFASPVINNLSKNISMIAIDVSSPFVVPLKLTFYISLLLSIPYFFWQIWMFLSPALYFQEKRIFFIIFILSIFFFYLGFSFSFFIIMPKMITFFVEISPNDLRISTDIQKYFDFFYSMCFSIAICFEVPIFTVIWCYFNKNNFEKIKLLRPYILILSFILGMLLTPPDILTQCLIAIPIYVLFEVGILIFSLAKKVNRL